MHLLRHSITHAHLTTAHGINAWETLQRQIEGGYEVHPIFIWRIGDNHACDLGVAWAWRFEPLYLVLAYGGHLFEPLILVALRWHFRESNAIFYA